jgi:uncharacterized RDD family membrane protein YckC
MTAPEQAGSPACSVASVEASTDPSRLTATPATLPRRLAAMVYESILATAIVLLATLAFPGATTGNLSAGARHVLLGYLLVVLGLYFTWCWSRGQTLAMRTWRLRLVGVDGRNMNWKRAMARYFLAVATIAPGLWAILWLSSRPASLQGWALVAITIATFAWTRRGPARQTLYDALTHSQLVFLGSSKP